MKKRYAIILVAVLFVLACTKPSTKNFLRNLDSTSNGIPPKGGVHASAILGKWWLGKYERHVDSSVDIEPNNDGDYVEFRANDSVYYTYADGTLGWDTYTIISDRLIIFNALLCTITWENGNFTLYNEEQNGYIKSWQTFLKPE